MSVAVDDTIPPEWMRPDKVAEVIGFVRSLPLLPSVKRQLVARWALMVGYKVTTEELAYAAGVHR